MDDSVLDTKLSKFNWQSDRTFQVNTGPGFETLVKQLPKEWDLTCFIWTGKANTWRSRTGRGAQRVGSMVDCEFRSTSKSGSKDLGWVYHIEKYFDEDEDALEYAARIRQFIDSKTIRELLKAKKAGDLHMSKLESKTWSVLESLFLESKQYRGDNSVTLTDLQKMVSAIAEAGGLHTPGLVHIEKGSRPKANIDKNGGMFSCDFNFDPKIWGKWFDSQDLALSMAAMDKDVTSQYAGRSQGHTVHKKNWGGQVVNTPGKPRGDFERRPSMMDRYDVLMQGEVTKSTKVDKKTKKVVEVASGRLLRVAYSPSIGSTEERKARLLALISGKQVPSLSRRPQPHTPHPDPADAADAISTKAPSVPRVGQNLKIVGDDEPESQRSASGTAPSSFSSFLSKHNAEYQPQSKRNRTDDDDAQDALDALFPKQKK